jgi:PII-like signaling protein
MWILGIAIVKRIIMGTKVHNCSKKEEFNLNFENPVITIIIPTNNVIKKILNSHIKIKLCNISNPLEVTLRRFCNLIFPHIATNRTLLKL